VPTRSPPFSRSIASLQTTSSHRKEATCVIPHCFTSQLRHSFWHNGQGHAPAHLHELGHAV
jgi:hypothetical protein